MHAEHFEENPPEKCNCSLPCAEFIYTPSISYAAVSNLRLEQLLLDPSLEKIKEKYNRALEVKERVQDKNRCNYDLL